MLSAEDWNGLTGLPGVVHVFNAGKIREELSEAMNPKSRVMRVAGGRWMRITQ